MFAEPHCSNSKRLLGKSIENTTAQCWVAIILMYDVRGLASVIENLTFCVVVELAGTKGKEQDGA